MSPKTLRRLMRQTLTQVGHRCSGKSVPQRRNCVRRSRRRWVARKKKTRASKKWRKIRCYDAPHRQPNSTSNGNGKCAQDAATNNIRKCATRRWLRRQHVFQSWESGKQVRAHTHPHTGIRNCGNFAGLHNLQWQRSVKNGPNIMPRQWG